MPQIKNTPELIVKYTIRSLLPGMGSSRGHWTRVYFNRVKISTDYGPVKKTILSDKPLSKDNALNFIESHGFVKLTSDKDTILYGNPDESFRDYARKHNIRIPDDIGISTVIENRNTCEKDF